MYKIRFQTVTPIPP